jgi:hypothetical protein
VQFKTNFTERCRHMHKFRAQVLSKTPSKTYRLQMYHSTSRVKVTEAWRILRVHNEELRITGM